MALDIGAVSLLLGPVDLLRSVQRTRPEAAWEHSNSRFSGYQRPARWNHKEETTSFVETRVMNISNGLLLLSILLGGASLARPDLVPIHILWCASAIGWGWTKRSMTAWIVVAMVVGGILGLDLPAHADKFVIPSKVFLKLIKTVIAPLLFSTLVVGIAGHADLKSVGRMGVKALVYFEFVTTLALFVGLAAINFSQAGVGIQQIAGGDQPEIKGVQQSFTDIILHIFPENIAKSVAEGDVLQVVVFSVLFAVSLALVAEHHRKPMLHMIESLAEVMFKFTGLIMALAPIAVGSAVAATVAKMGTSVLLNLLKLLLTLYGALAIFLVFVLLPIAYFAKVPIRAFIKAISEPVSIAFATTSSEAALPLAMEKLELLGVPRSVVAFVLPTGYSFNLDGTTLYLSLAAVFVAQAASVPFNFTQQVVMVVTLMITSKGVAGVPRASLVILLGTAASFNLPEWPILAILGIDGLMDMARTAVNVIGNCLASVVIAQWEGVFRPNFASGLYDGYPLADVAAAGLQPGDIEVPHS